MTRSLAMPVVAGVVAVAATATFAGTAGELVGLHRKPKSVRSSIVRLFRGHHQVLHE